MRDYETGYDDTPEPPDCRDCSAPVGADGVYCPWCADDHDAMMTEPPAAGRWIRPPA